MIRAHNFLPMAVLAAMLALCASCAPSYEPERTSWGTPKIEGLWDFRTLTPFERPAELADKAILTAEEAEVIRQKTIQALDVDNRSGDASIGDVEQAYNTVWWDWGTNLNEDLRTSLIVDPPNGRLPEMG